MSAILFKRKLILVLLSGILGVAAWSVFRTVAADSNAPPPPPPKVIQEGFDAWKKTGPSDAFYRWQKGGLMENGSKYGMLAGYFRRMDQALGNYQSFAIVEAKYIGDNSVVLYLTLNFERAEVYARFLLYRTMKGWVVQNMDFSTRPEAVMPWLAFQEVNYSE